MLLNAQFYQIRMSLPPEWRIKHSKTRGGRVFYYNKLTKETRWDCPVSPIDEADYPEVELPGDVKNVKNSDNAKQIVNSSSHSGHLNKRRRTDSKKNDNKVGSSGKADVHGKNLATKPNLCIRTSSKGKTKQKQSSGEMTKEKSKGMPGTNLYREANLCDLNAFLGGDCVKGGTRDSILGGGDNDQPERKSREEKREGSEEKRGGSAASRTNSGSLREKSDVAASARLSDLKTYLEECRGSPKQNTSPCSVKEIKILKEGRLSKKVESVDPSPKSSAIMTKTKDVHRSKREIKSSPYSRPSQTGVSKCYKIPKVSTANSDECSTSRRQTKRSLKISADRNPEIIPLDMSAGKSSSSDAVSLKRKLKTDEVLTPTQPKDLPTTSQSLIGKIVTSSWNFLARTLTSTTAPETGCGITNPAPQTGGAPSGGIGSLRGVTKGRGSSQSTISLQTQGKSSTDYSDDDCEMMEIDDVVATVSEIRSSIHNSHNGPDSSFLAAAHVTNPISLENDPGLKDIGAGATSAIQTFLVLDTNVLIHDLCFVEELVKLSNQERSTVVIPWIVLQELDGLKSTSNVSKAARKAIDYLLECRKSRREGVVFEPNSKIRTELADDRILLCLEGICEEDENCSAVLVSCDKNLRLKADVNGFESYGISELRNMLNMLGSSDGDRSPDLHSSSSSSHRTFSRMRRTDPTLTVPTSVLPRRPKPSSVTTSPHIQVTSTTAVRIGRSSPGDYPSTRPPTNVDLNSFHDNDISTTRKNNVDPNSFRDISTTRRDKVDPNSFRDISTTRRNNVDPNSLHDISTTRKDIRDPLSQDNIIMARPGSKSPPSSPIDMRLAMFTGETSPKPEPRSDIARFDKSVLQVLDDMSGSMTVFRQQVVTFVEQKLSVPGPGLTVQLTELQNFLSVLIPDVNKFLDSCRAFHQVPVSQLKNNFTAVCDLVSAIQSFSVHHLHYAPNIAASDAFVWLVEPGHVNHLSATERHFTGLLAEIERAVEALMARKQFV